MRARASPIVFEFARSRYSDGARLALVERLLRRYTTVHGLGRGDRPVPIAALSSRTHTDGVLVY